jgi:hypothetical protein
MGSGEGLEKMPERRRFLFNMIRDGGRNSGRACVDRFP